MFQPQIVERAISGRPRTVIQRRIAFKKRDEGNGLIERQHFAIAPDTAPVDGIVRGSARRPTLPQRSGIAGRLAQHLRVSLYFECAAAAWADVNALAQAEASAAGRVDAALHGLFRCARGLLRHFRKPWLSLPPARTRGASPPAPPSFLFPRRQRKYSIPRSPVRWR